VRGDGVPSTITSSATGTTLCLSTISHDPVKVVPCAGDGSRWVYNRTNFTIAVAAAAQGTLVGKGVGACIDIMGGGGPAVDVWTCHPAGDSDAPNQQILYNATDRSLRSPHPALAGKCFTLNRTAENPFVRTPCDWPNRPRAGLPVAQSATFTGVTILENATVIPYFGADTFYPAEDKHGHFMTGFDDGGLGGGGSSSVSVGSSSPTGHGSTTGAAIVSGGKDWRHLRVEAVGGPIVEDGYPMLGRYTSANAVINGTWWTGTYGLGISSKACPIAMCPGQSPADTTTSLSLMIGPFVGFRTSTNNGENWTEPRTPGGAAINVSHNLFGEVAADGPPSEMPAGSPAGVKFGSPHVVDHGPENMHSPDGGLYIVAGGCLNPWATENCTWISGDGVFLARATDFSAAAPDSLNDRANWEFWAGGGGGGEDDGAAATEWAPTVASAKPVFKWRGRVGAVTASWNPTLRKYFLCITAPSTHAWNNESPYDTYILEAPKLTGPFSLVTYMPQFGMQAYFVSMPSAWMGTLPTTSTADTEGKGEKGRDGVVAESGTSDYDAVLTFSANFACRLEGCAPNILNAGYGANLLPVRFTVKKASG
jgi:hypothetical protein